MMFKTHLTIGVFLVLLFLPLVDFKLTFILVTLFCTLLPDIDMSQSFLGKYKILRPLQWVVSHRGVFHSFTLAIIISVLFALYFPILALPFFLGYSGHLIADSLTKEGIRPFWPLKDEITWKIKTGGRTESVIFYTLVIVDIILLLRLFI